MRKLSRAKELRKDERGVVSIGMLIVVGVIILGFTVNWLSQQTPRENNSMIQKIVENPEKYDSKVVTIEGKYKEPQCLVDYRDYRISLQPYLSENWPLEDGHYYEITGEVEYSVQLDILQIRVVSVEEI